MFDRIVEGPPKPRFAFTFEGMLAVAIFVFRSLPFGIAFLLFFAFRWLAGKRQLEKHPLLPGVALQVSALVASLAIAVIVGHIQFALPDVVVAGGLLFWLVRRPGLIPALFVALVDLAMAGFVDPASFRQLEPGGARDQLLHLAMLRLVAGTVLLVGALRLARWSLPESKTTRGLSALE
jgi:hypothetical protein